jgi:hypothetical protein
MVTILIKEQQKLLSFNNNPKKAVQCDAPGGHLVHLCCRIGPAHRDKPVRYVSDIPMWTHRLTYVSVVFAKRFVDMRIGAS